MTLNIFKSIFVVSLLFVSILFVCGCGSKPDPKPELGGLPSPEEMAKIMKEASRPAPEHLMLKPTIGTWRAVSRWKISPDTPDRVSTALSKKVLAMNGLFVEEEYVDKNNKAPFIGKGIYGYDKVAGQFTAAWYDTMTSGMWLSTGSPANDGKIINYEGGSSCPITGEYTENRSELVIVNNNKHILKMYDIAPDGKEYRSLEILYERLRG